MLTLTQKIAIIIPGTINNVHDHKAQKAMVEHCLRVLATACGGATALPGEGAYVMQETGELVVEPVVKVEAYTTSAADHFGTLMRLAQHVRRSMEQESVGIEINGEFSLVEAADQAATEAA